jgi:hypothetical protein
MDGAQNNPAPYYLQQERNYAFDDQNDLRTNANFLLTTGNVTAEDRTPQIVGNQIRGSAVGSSR